MAMSSFRQRMDVQKKKKECMEPHDDLKKRIVELQHKLFMYQRCILFFEEKSKEWEICRDSIYDIVSELSILEQREAAKKDG